MKLTNLHRGYILNREQEPTFKLKKCVSFLFNQFRFYGKNRMFLVVNIMFTADNMLFAAEYFFTLYLVVSPYKYVFSGSGCHRHSASKVAQNTSIQPYLTLYQINLSVCE